MPTHVQVETALEGVPESARAADLLDVFCERCCAKQAQVAHAANFFQPGQMMVEAIQGGLPRPHAVQVRTLDRAVPALSRLKLEAQHDSTGRHGCISAALLSSSPPCFLAGPCLRVSPPVKACVPRQCAAGFLVLWQAPRRC